MLALLVFILINNLIAQQVTSTSDQLNKKQQSIVTIAAFTAKGDMVQLQKALNTGLDAALTVNEIKEILVQLYAYAGFPRSLNALHSLMDVLKERKSKGEIRIDRHISTTYLDIACKVKTLGLKTEIAFIILPVKHGNRECSATSLQIYLSKNSKRKKNTNKTQIEKLFVHNALFS